MMDIQLLAALTATGAVEEETVKYLGLGTVSLAFMALVLALILFKAALVAAAIWLEATCPRLSARAVHYYQDRPARCYIAGLVNAIVGTFLTLLLLASGVLTLVGLLLAVLLIFLTVLGFAAGYRTVAQRLYPDASETTAPLVRAGLVTELVFLIPLVGQVYFLNILLRGLGAATLSLLSLRKQPASPE